VIEHLGARIEFRDVAFGGVHTQPFGAHLRQPVGFLLIVGQAARDHGVAGAPEAAADRGADAAHAARDEHDAMHERRFAFLCYLGFFQHARH